MEEFVLGCVATLMLKFIKRLLVRSDGQDLVEYALLAAFISIATLVALGGIGGNVGATYQNVDTAVAAAKTSDDPGQPGAGGSDPGASDPASSDSGSGSGSAGGGAGNGNGNNGNGNGNGGGNGSNGSGNGNGNNGNGNGNGGGSGSNGKGGGRGNSGSLIGL